MPDFSDAKVGDKIWDNWLGGYATVEFIDYVKKFISFKTEKSRFNGTDLWNQNENSPPRYYWDKLEFTDPPKPKRIVKETRWYIFKRRDKSKNEHPYPIGLINGYPSKEEAEDFCKKFSASSNYILPIEYEVEE